MSLMYGASPARLRSRMNARKASGPYNLYTADDGDVSARSAESSRPAGSRSLDSGDDSDVPLSATLRRKRQRAKRQHERDMDVLSRHIDLVGLDSGPGCSTDSAAPIDDADALALSFSAIDIDLPWRSNLHSTRPLTARELRQKGAARRENARHGIARADAIRRAAARRDADPHAQGSCVGAGWGAGHSPAMPVWMSVQTSHGTWISPYTFSYTAGH
ncbi:hypothetical protein OBBRIDRAFT_798860 [Obba rivulosa]|uniref:Uncharacterized protein n=1 Tax=Obba rivulosa TaxID=1052685 RepID=A0A8E2AQ69_9APHY|nr:hypothetical protein OBBRIDRAFT_798860 [Obba rivulosa]